jgi:uncharacterized protein YjbI with pentapeptide repeats
VHAARDFHSLVINSQSFAGGASFVLRTLKLKGVLPSPAPTRPQPFTLAGPGISVSAADILGALQASQDIDLRDCTIEGSLDLGQIASPITSHIRMQDCRFTGSFVASNPVSVMSAVSFLNCQFNVVGLSNVEFNRPLSMVNCQFAADTRFIYTHFRGGSNFSASTFNEKPFFRAAQAARPMSLYHSTFLKGADLSNANFDDLSLSDVAVREGSIVLYKSEITGTLRLMATLQRDPQPLGSEWDLSNTQIGRLVISAGDRLNQREQTGPALWNLDSNVFLRNAVVGQVELYNVHFARALDLSGAAFQSRELHNATFTNLIGGWPVYYSCFISYSSRDAEFAARLYSELEKNGVTCWFAPEDIKIGVEFRQHIEDAIHGHDRLLLILSESSVHSDWVKYEVEACLELEQRQRRQVLFPIRLDGAVMRTRRAWAALIRRERHVGDFTDWHNQQAYERAFQRLLRDLRAQNRTP